MSNSAMPQIGFRPPRRAWFVPSLAIVIAVGTLLVMTRPRSERKQQPVAEREVDVATAAVPDEPAPDPVEPDLDALVRMAMRHGMQMPPDGARLVLADTGWTTVLGNRSTSRDPAIYSPAFVLEEKPDGSGIVLRG